MRNTTSAQSRTIWQRTLRHYDRARPCQRHPPPTPTYLHPLPLPPRRTLKLVPCVQTPPRPRHHCPMRPLRFARYRSIIPCLPGKLRLHRATQLLRRERERLLDHDTHDYRVFPGYPHKAQALAADARLRSYALPAQYRDSDQLDPALEATLQLVCQDLALCTRFEG